MSGLRRCFGDKINENQMTPCSTPSQGNLSKGCRIISKSWTLTFQLNMSKLSKLKLLNGPKISNFDYRKPSFQVVLKRLELRFIQLLRSPFLMRPFNILGRDFPEPKKIQILRHQKKNICQRNDEATIKLGLSEILYSVFPRVLSP